MEGYAQIKLLQPKLEIYQDMKFVTFNCKVLEKIERC